MPVLDEPGVQVDDEHVVGVDSDTLVADYNGLLDLTLLRGLRHEMEVAVANVEFVGPSDQVLGRF